MVMIHAILLYRPMNAVFYFSLLFSSRVEWNIQKWEFCYLSLWNENRDDFIHSRYTVVLMHSNSACECSDHSCNRIERKKSPLASSAHYVCRLFVTHRPNYKYGLRSYYTNRAQRVLEHDGSRFREEQRRLRSVWHRQFLFTIFILFISFFSHFRVLTRVSFFQFSFCAQLHGAIVRKYNGKTTQTVNVCHESELKNKKN